jgi:hypothetical protein
MSDTPSTTVHALAERITKLLGVTPDEHTMWQLITMLGRFREAVDAGTQDALDSARMALDDAREAREEAEPCSTPRAVSHRRGSGCACNASAGGPNCGNCLLARGKSLSTQRVWGGPERGCWRGLRAAVPGE